MLTTLPRLALFAATSISLLALAAAQSEPARAERSAILGRVSMLDGKPWVNAEVHFFSRPLGAIGFGAPDHVRCKSDERGRFRAQLISGREYSAWAIGTGDDAHEASLVAEGVYAGIPVRLEQDPFPRPATRLRIRAAKEYGERLDGFRIRFVAPMRNQWTVEVPIEGRECMVPTLPGRIAIAEVLDEKRRPILVYRFLLTLDEAYGDFGATKKGWRDKFAEAMAREQSLSMIRSGRVRNFPLQILAPLRKSVRVMTTEDSKPVPGARISGRVQYSTSSVRLEYETTRRVTWVELGVTGEDGSAVLDIPDAVLRTTYWNDVVLNAQKDGFAATQLIVKDVARESPASRISKILKQREDEEAKPDAPLEFRLAPVPALTLRLRAADGSRSSVANRVLRLIATKNMNDNVDEVWSFTTLQQRVETDADGRFTIPGLLPERQFVLQMAVDAALLGDLGITDAPAPMPTALLFVKDSSELESRDIELASLRCIDLEVTRPDGSPASGARAVLLPAWTERLWDLAGTELTLSSLADRRGRVRFVAGRGACELVFIDEESKSFAHVEVSAAGAQREPRIARAVRLRPMQEYSGVVLDSKNRPVAGAHLDLSGQTQGIENTALAEFVSDTIKTHIESDSEGRFVFHVLPIQLSELEIAAMTPDLGHDVELQFAPGTTGRKDLEIQFEVEAGPAKKGK
ncbi:MAG: carboxypeptidase regulatory-like domain-containing protein [Planctomycetes bacterium]|nr:carboxypeptidase regulatory-like domain-containing protein [Planctomycetota bacterium]